MADQLTRAALVRWLAQHGFRLQPGRQTSHQQYTDVNGLRITVPGHGPADLTKKHAGMIRRRLRQGGYDVAEL